MKIRWRKRRKYCEEDIDSHFYNIENSKESLKRLLEIITFFVGYFPPENEARRLARLWVSLEEFVLKAHRMESETNNLVDFYDLNDRRKDQAFTALLTLNKIIEKNDKSPEYKSLHNAICDLWDVLGRISFERFEENEEKKTDGRIQ